MDIPSVRIALCKFLEENIRLHGREGILEMLVTKLGTNLTKPQIILLLVGMETEKNVSKELTVHKM